MCPLDLLQLTALLARTSGLREVGIGLIDGPVLLTHPDLASENICVIPGTLRGTCARAGSLACMHGTFVAGMLSGRRGSAPLAICPDCTLFVRPIFAEGTPDSGQMPSATPEELAEAIVDCVDSGARVLNLSAGLTRPTSSGERELAQALDYAASHGLISVAAAGNQGTLASSAITRHASVIPVVACDLQARPLIASNLGNSIGRRGFMAPGAGITSLGTDGKVQTITGTSAAAPFVTGTIALLWSAFPGSNANQIRLALTRLGASRRRAIAPPLLDAYAAYQAMHSIQ
ncbi:hypothetical protein PTKU46_82930 [Paraburkholderia terrae]|uniref:S8 family serine peptidase n=1 Tax=Paraburkholderia terrae TaxID=311230 RepID=UPI0030E3E2F6